MREKLANFKEIIYKAAISFCANSSCSYFAGIYNKNCIQRKLHCSVFQFTDTAFQQHFKTFTEFKQSFSRLPEATFNEALH